MTVTREEVVAEARDWLGTKYVHQHRIKGHAVDCAGLVIGVARACGIVAPDFDVNGYERIPDGKSLLALCDRFMTRIPTAQVQPGDVMVFAFDQYPGHLGIVGDYPGGVSIIQALGTSDGKGKVVESRHLVGRKGWRAVQGYAMPGVV